MKKQWSIFFLCIIVCFWISGMETNAISEHPKRLVDESGLLTSGEADRLLEQLDEISERQQCDVVIVTAHSLDGKTATAYADDYFDYNGYGLGVQKDGILLLVSMGEREWAISTHGEAIDVFTDNGQESMTDLFVPKLSDGNYFGAFEQFAELCDEFLTQAKTGEPYDVKNEYNSHTAFPNYFILIAIGSGVLIALVVVSIMKGTLKSVRTQVTADNYIRSNSLHIRHQHDYFLYRHISKTARPKDNDSGGSSIHVSSSGETHGGSSGSF